jgi:hypothetical protein
VFWTMAFDQGTELLEWRARISIDILELGSFPSWQTVVLGSYFPLCGNLCIAECIRSRYLLS